MKYNTYIYLPRMKYGLEIEAPFGLFSKSIINNPSTTHTNAHFANKLIK